MSKPADLNDVLRRDGIDAARQQWDNASIVPLDIGRNGGTGKAVLTARRASDIKIVPVAWLWPRRIALGKWSLIAGEPGLGKSQVALAMAAAVTIGGLWPCGEGCAPL